MQAKKTYVLEQYLYISQYKIFAWLFIFQTENETLQMVVINML